jgi:hypothetical protein
LSIRRALLLGLVAVVSLLALSSPASAATCADYPDQAAGQRAADTRDADGDGVYCETLPCPCLAPGGDSAPAPTTRARCSSPGGVENIFFSRVKYPNIRAHFRAALRRGWPRILVINRPGADARRDRLLGGLPTRAAYDRDEYPPAVGRGRGRGLVGGSAPRGWKGDVRYVPSAENRSHGSSLGSKLRRFCDGTRFRYVFR